MLKLYAVSFVLVTVLIVQSCAGSRGRNTAPYEQKNEPHPRAVRLFVDGVDYETENNFPAALLMFHEAAMYDSLSPAIQCNIGRNYLRLGNEESALLALRRSLRLNPDQIEPRELLARIYANRNWWDLSLKANQSIVLRDSLNENAWYRLALLHTRLNQPEAAIQAYEKLLKFHSQPDPKILIGLSELYFDSERFEDAARVFQLLILQKPADGFGYFGMGMCYEAGKDTTAAIEMYRQAWNLSHDLEDARDRLVRLLVQQEDWDGAVRFFEHEIVRDSTNIEHWLALTDLYEASGDSLHAIITHQKMLDLFPDSTRAHLAYGRHLIRQGRYADATVLFRAATMLDTSNGFAWLFSAISYAHLDSLDPAVEGLTEALKILPEDPLGNYYLGTIYIQKKMFQEAIAPLELALQTRPDWLAALGALAGAYESLKVYDKADSLFRHCLDADPENALFLNNYAYSLSLRGERLDEALDMATRALGMAPENGAYLDTVGWIYFKLGRSQKALEYIEKAAALRDDSAEVFDHLGDVYETLGMQAEARAAWEKALDLDRDNAEIRNKLHASDAERD